MAVSASGFTSRSVNRNNTTYPTVSSLSPAWSSLMNSYGVRDSGFYEWDITVASRGLQKFQIAADDAAQVYLDGEYIGAAGPSSDSAILISTENYEVSDNMILTIISTDGGIKPTAISARHVGVDYTPVNISLFEVSPPVAFNTSQILLSWSTSNATKLEIDNNVGDVTGLNFVNVETFLKSNNNVQSPATKLYTLTAYGAARGDIQTATVEAVVRNDNIPDDFQIPIFPDREPEETITYDTNPITGIDVSITVSGDGNVLVSEVGSNSFTNSITLGPNNQGVRLRFQTPDFNPSPDTTVNTVNYSVNFGPVTKYFQVTTRAPDDAEIFDFGDIKQEIPFPVPPGNAETQQPELQSPTTVELTPELWEVELQDVDRTNELDGVEIRANDNNLEVRVKPLGGAWQSWETPNNMYNAIGDASPTLFDAMDLNPIATRSGNLPNTAPRSISTRVSGILLSRNIQSS